MQWTIRKTDGPAMALTRRLALATVELSNSKISEHLNGCSMALYTVLYVVFRYFYLEALRVLFHRFGRLLGGFSPVFMLCSRVF